MAGKYINRDIIAYEAGLFASIFFMLFTTTITVAFISNGWTIFGTVTGSITAAAGFSAWHNIRQWMEERQEIAAFKQQTRTLFIFSRGESETHEDDAEMTARVDYAINTLRKAGNPHCITVWMVMFRDITMFGYELTEACEIRTVHRIPRESILFQSDDPRESKRFFVRETRQEYREFCELMRATMEQRELAEAREAKNSDEWVHRHWFNQQ